MKKAKEYIYITIGFIIVALAGQLFLIPNNIAAGGVMGIAIIINHFIPILSVGLLMFILNIILLIIAFAKIGGKFGFKTIYASLGLSGSIWIFENLLPFKIALTDDLLLAAIFGTLFSGIGMGIVFNQNASTGGTDIIAKILNKVTHFDIGKSLLIVDFIVTLFAALTFNLEIGMYSLLSVIVNGFVIDSVIEGFNLCKQVLIISTKNDIINTFIIDELDRSSTLIQCLGGYTKKETYILYTVLNRKEFVKLRNYIKEVDSCAFITVSDAREVLGEGFKDIVSEN